MNNAAIKTRRTQRMIVVLRDGADKVALVIAFAPLLGRPKRDAAIGSLL
jgi:hypothetical protein